MNKKLTPLEYGKMACDTMMRRYDVNELPPPTYGRATFNYHQGVFLTGMSRVYNLCKDPRYLDYIQRWAKATQNEDGTIFEPEGADWISLRTLDYRQPANVLFFLHEQTGDPHYVELLKYLTEDLYHNYPRNEYGGFWHFFTTPGQMWVDGLYMAGVLLVHYGHLTSQPEYIELGIQQIFLMYEHMRDPVSGLLFHGWDPTYQASWADPVTGCSPIIWGRACGWFVLAIADMLDYIPQDHPQRERIIAIQREFIDCVVKCQSAEGRWYEVTDKPEAEGNWPENSSTCLFIYSICKGIRQGYVDEKYLANATRAYERIIETLLPAPEGEFSLGDICIGTCIDDGDYAHYINRPRTENDLHGVGAFLLMIGELAQLVKE